jgi:large conductance mechanosensitive channel
VKGFRAFLLRGNVVDLAVAVVVGGAFGAVVTALVAAFLTPLVGLATGAAGDFSQLAFCVGGSCAEGGEGVLFPYGQFVQALLSFALVATVVYFFVVRPVNALMEHFKTEPEVQSQTKACTECLSNIPVAARRCAFCTEPQPPAG